MKIFNPLITGFFYAQFFIFVELLGWVGLGASSPTQPSSSKNRAWLGGITRSIKPDLRACAQLKYKSLRYQDVVPLMNGGRLFLPFPVLFNTTATVQTPLPDQLANSHFRTRHNANKVSNLICQENGCVKKL